MLCTNVSLKTFTSLLAGGILLIPSLALGQGASPDAPRLDTAETPAPSEGLATVFTAAATSPSETDGGFSARYLKGRLQIGTRSVYRHLTHSDSGAMGGGQGSGTFLGSIYALKENQNELPIQPFLTYYFSTYFGIELAYDSLDAETVAYSNDMVKTDGDVSLSGPTLTLLGRYPNSTAFTPYMGAGIGFFQGDFSPDAAWALGYENPVVYKSLGSPSTLCDGTSRKMEVENSVAVLLTAGVTYRIHPHWSLDLSAEYIRAQADAVFRSTIYGASFVNDPGSFPLSNVTVRLGLAYTF